MTRLIRNLSCAVFITAALSSSPVFGSGECPPELTGMCLGCEWTTNGYWYTGCEEDCEFNEDLCDEVCNNTSEQDDDDCHQSQFPEITCGQCYCQNPFPEDGESSGVRRKEC